MYFCVAHTQDKASKMKLGFATACDTVLANACVRFCILKWGNETTVLCLGSVSVVTLSLIDLDVGCCHAAEVPVSLVQGRFGLRAVCSHLLRPVQQQSHSAQDLRQHHQGQSCSSSLTASPISPAAAGAQASFLPTSSQCRPSHALAAHVPKQPVTVGHAVTFNAVMHCI